MQTSIEKEVANGISDSISSQNATVPSISQDSQSSSSVSVPSQSKKRVIVDSDDEDDDIPLVQQLRKVNAAKAVVKNIEEKIVSSPAIPSDSDDDIPLVKLAAKSSKVVSTAAERLRLNSGKAVAAKTLKEKVTVTKRVIVKTVKAEGSEKAVKQVRSTRTAKAEVSAVALVQNKEAKKKELSTDKSTGKHYLKSHTADDTTQEKTAEDGVEDEYKWWEEYTAEDDSIKWKTLVHQGVLFPPPYTPINVPIRYNGENVILPPASEEIAGFFAALAGADHVNNPIFVANFFEDFRESLKGTDLYKKLISFEKCDFTQLTEYFAQQREAKKALSKEEKKRLKEEKLKVEADYTYCLLDGRKEKVGNFRIEPPGLFKGRGKHPKAGKVKQRVQPEQVTINIGSDAPIPKAPEGHIWKEIVHDNTVTWLATWTENVNNNIKYVFLAANSSLKGQSDLKKFEKARELRNFIDVIRKTNASELKSSDVSIRQRATALWLIDRLALRAGNEKGDDEADTVGCCSLRCEHIQLTDPNTVTFDFLGKDSIRYFNQVQVDPIIYKNLKQFMDSFETAGEKKKTKKKPDDLIFDQLSTSSLNKYLTTLMPGLTAKVFRTYNASATFQDELEKCDVPDALPDKLLHYNRANREVAVLCNHQRAVSKNHSQTMGRMRDKIMTLKYQRHLYKQDLKKQMKEEAVKVPKDVLEPESDMDQEMIQLKAKELADQKAEKLALKQSQDNATDSPKKVASSSTRTYNAEALLKKISDLSLRITAAKTQLIDRDENKATALSTSKVNYIDPRITVSWAAKNSVPIEKLFNKTLKDKFKWAMTVLPTWRF